MIKSPYDIIRKPLMTEKSTQSKEKLNSYIFEVAIKSNKPEIKKAIETIFPVKVARVRTMMMKGKPKKYRFQVIHKSDWKKAIITLKDGRIDII